MTLVPVEEPESSCGRYESNWRCIPLESRRCCEANKADGQRLQQSDCSLPVACESTELCLNLPGGKLAKLLTQLIAMTRESTGRCHNEHIHLLDGFATSCTGATCSKGGGGSCVFSRNGWQTVKLVSAFTGSLRG